MKKALSFSDLFASDIDKSTSEFGLKFADAIAQEWFNGGMVQTGCEYNTRKSWISNRRLYALGKQDLKPYKDVIAREQNDLSYFNLDWRPTNILGKFNKIVADGGEEDEYDVTVRATDKSAIASRKKYENELVKNMISKDLMEEAYQLLGIDLRPDSFVPENEEELEIHLMLKPKEKIEVAEEVLIDTVFKSNDWDIIKPLIKMDLVNIGIGVAKCYTDKIDGIKLSYVDPEFFVHSYVTTPYFDDAYYFGEIKTRTISQLKRDGGFTNFQLNQIANSYASQNGGFVQDYSGDYLSDSVLNYKVAVLDFTFKTTKDIVYKKTIKDKGIKLTPKDSTYNPPVRADYERVDKTVFTWYEGSYIVGTDFLYNYGESENVANDTFNKVLPNYICYAPEMYKGDLVSFSSTIEPIADKMNYVDLKLQHLIAEIKPDGAEINMDKLYELASDSKSNEKEILSLFAVKGIVLAKTVTDEGGNEYRSRAVESIRNGVPDNIMSLVQIWEHYYNVIREITGVNPFRDGSQRPDTLVGVQESAMKQSNVATKFLTRGSMFITKKTAECITSRMNTIFRWGNNLKLVYSDALGQRNASLLESIKNRHIHTFGIHIVMKPTKEEILDLNNNIALAIQAGDIKVEDKIEIMNIGNFKNANNYLRYRSKTRRKEMQEDAQILQQQQAQAQAQSIEASGEQARNNMIFQSELEVQKEAQLSQIRIQEEIAKAQIMAEKDNAKFQSAQYVAQMNAIANQGLNVFKEDRKDFRTEKQATQQSKMIHQRMNSGKPINFENGNSIDYDGDNGDGYLDEDMDETESNSNNL